MALTWKRKTKPPGSSNLSMGCVFLSSFIKALSFVTLHIVASDILAGMQG